MLGDILFFDNNRALQAKPVGGEGARDGVVPQALANLGENGDLVVYGPQDGLVMLDAGVCCFLALVQQELHMFCMRCEQGHQPTEVYILIGAMEGEGIGRTTTKHRAALDGGIDLDVLGRGRRLRACRHFDQWLIINPPKCSQRLVLFVTAGSLPLLSSLGRWGAATVGSEERPGRGAIRVCVEPVEMPNAPGRRELQGRQVAQAPEDMERKEVGPPELGMGEGTSRNDGWWGRGARAAGGWLCGGEGGRWMD